MRTALCVCVDKNVASCLIKVLGLHFWNCCLSIDDSPDAAAEKVGKKGMAAFGVRNLIQFESVKWKEWGFCIQ